MKEMEGRVVGRMMQAGGSLNLSSGETVIFNNPGKIIVIGGRFKLEFGRLKELTLEEKMKLIDHKLKETRDFHWRCEAAK